jgi:cytochrome b6
MGFLYDWCEERFEFQAIADDILAKFVPAHINIFYSLMIIGQQL